jgi:RND family efflux transporter MFP subunit
VNLETLRALSTRAKLVVAAGAVSGMAVAATFAIPGQVTWSDARATTRLAPPRLQLDAAKLVDDRVTVQGVAYAAAPMVSAHGVVRSGEEAVIASRMTALITALPLEAGQSFARGALLAGFDCSQMRAQLSAAEAAAAAYRKTYDTNVELDQYKAIGTNEVAVSKANLGKAAAEAQAIRAGTGQCAIHAPFAGTVVERIAHPHDVAAPGQPLLKIQGAGALEVELIVPSKWLTWLKPGTPFSFRLEETGGTVQGTIARLGAAVDPVSKTMRVSGRIVAEGTVLPGMSGTAQFAGQPVASGSDGRTV